MYSVTVINMSSSCEFIFSKEILNYIQHLKLFSESILLQTVSTYFEKNLWGSLFIVELHEKLGMKPREIPPIFALSAP